ncbi:DUF2584 domain-containing protein [Aquibacillus koreensis]|uniref:DUF2584 domain-containing protein n=1 Tax=Aquibacillus koreensis TaxID=279446 RepID=A0A9X3WQ61_9BACI|nr:DUF2584 domain-containing protein [Aquibacillus koreensis]MCT2535045.1 DUF2584 domain-containing protein [Aquibacillus koreensis]MDC3422833.1 DUF2584 domain-containing protein [Aquibacillus koreensis]
MSMPLAFEWRLITHGKEKRIVGEENLFEITCNGYKVFPINEQIEIRRHHDSDQIGNGKIVELTWKNDVTICKYQLLSLYNVN